MTAQPANLNGVERHGDFLDPGARTVAHSFESAGYRTSYVGKWHLAPESGAAMVSPEGWAGQEFWVHPRLRGGFRDWFGFNIANNYYRTYICSSEKVEPIPLAGYQTDALTDLSIDYLTRIASEEGGAPWFHVISYESPHPGAGGPAGSGGYPVPPAYAALHDPSGIELRPNVPPSHAGAAREQLAGYYRLIANLDDNVGRLLAHLDAIGEGERTLVAFLSDHGEMGGSHGLRNKQVPYEESLHIPLMLRLPGCLPAGAQHHGSICGLDVAPTTLGLCGLPAMSGAKGLDHSGALMSEAADDERPLRDAVLVQWNDTRFRFGDHPYRALRSPRYTLSVGRDDAFCLLFDREHDPFELDDLYWQPEHAELRRSLGARLLTLLAEAEEPVPEYVARRLA